MKHIELHRFDVEIHINTSHGHKLEPLFDYMYHERNKHYMDILIDQLKKVDVYVIQWGAYGGVWVTIRAETMLQLEQDIVKANKCVGEWLRKYNINRMKIPANYKG